MAHVGWGGFLATVIGGIWGPFEGGVVILSFSAIKEFLFDRLTATPVPPIKSDAIDFGFWTVGNALGTLAAIWIRHHLGA